jgi:alkyl hydroperoxide reductase subunit AhpC
MLQLSEVYLKCPAIALHEGDTMIKVGEKAPVFSAEAYVDGKIARISMSDFKKKWIVLFFYPRDFTFVCPTEIAGFARLEPEFKRSGGVVIGASTDSVYSHKAWFERDLTMVKYPVLADTNHSIARAYDVLIESTGDALRGTFIIDPEGIVQYAVVSNLNVGRSVEETLRVLQALNTGGLCPVDWKPGQPTLNQAKARAK